MTCVRTGTRDPAPRPTAARHSPRVRSLPGGNGAGRLRGSGPSTGTATRGISAVARARPRPGSRARPPARTAAWAGMTLSWNALASAWTDACLVGGVLGMLERVDRVHELIGQGRDLVRRPLPAPFDLPASGAGPGTRAAAGRIMVLADVHGQLASMFETLT